MNKVKMLFLLFLFLLLLPFMVNAKECKKNSIKINEISVEDKSEYTEQLTDVTFKDNKINLDLKMFDVGDYIEYKLNVENTSDDVYYFDSNSLNINSNYFDYLLSYEGNTNKIEPNSEKTVFLKVKYKKEVEKDKFFNGKYVDNKDVIMNLSTKNPVFTNPFTMNNR